jgi:acyl-CoA dehydrogenase
MLSRLVRPAWLRNLVPALSPTEREALEAGTVWADGELFSGKPDFARLLKEPYPRLSEEERAFLDGSVREACRLVDEWEVSRRRELPPSVLPFLKEQGFFGLNIPREYGGRGFSALACSTVFGRLASRSLALSSVVLIPNSVGPAELLLTHGTRAQKDLYLPRLARGDDIPCFALTEPEAGSDAASLRSHGTVFQGGDGRLLLRLDFKKRYITLAPIATLIGLAVRLQDPEHLLGLGEEVGITCVLVPASAPGVEIGRRHDPMGVPFPNGPIEGRGVVVDVDQIIGGSAGAGRGWPMLMEALASGRGISVPGQSVAGMKAIARGVGAYAAVRQQFGLPIARFEGIEEPLARMAGLTYMLEAARVYTCGAVDSGHRPSVISAIVKYHSTEALRALVADGMDVMGGAGLCLGPRNLMAKGHLGAPIGITVEGANILTRTLIIYGQGAIRCHPYAQREIRALAAGTGGGLLLALLGHAFFFVRNLVREAILGLCRGALARAPVVDPTARYYRRLAWASARFAVLSDLALLSLGGRLKFRGKLTGRFADALSWMYLGLSALRRFEAEGRLAEDRPLVQWALEHALHRVQAAFDGILGNAEGWLLGALLRGPFALWSRLNPIGNPPSDRLGSRLARILTTPGPQRDRLTEGIYLPTDPGEALGRIERAFRLVTEAGPLLDRLRRQARAGALPKAPLGEQVAEARKRGLLSEREGSLLDEAAEAREEAIQVDSFTIQEYLRRGASAEHQEETVTTSP